MSYQAPITTQVPNEEMFYQGRLTPAWTMFFQRLARLAALGNLANLIELMQLANQQASQATLATQANQIEQLSTLAQSVPVPIQTEQIPPIMPLSAVFLCEQEAIMPLTLIPDEFLKVIVP